MRFQAVGMRGDAGFDSIVGHFQSLGGDCVLLNPGMVAGRDHLLSAASHAERSFSEGTNRSNSLLTEIILYAAWERQIGKALARMRPAEGCREYAAVLVDIDDPRLGDIGMERDDSLLECTPEKASALGLDGPFASPEDQALELVALLEIQKARFSGFLCTTYLRPFC
ncbi:MAG: KEOPS complex subunit Cgi121 [Thermoplasmata archaeon]|nr:KEOPS complex subunit Cgi121 [Thermoplasmata archaeon]